MKLSFMLQKNCIFTNIKGGCRGREDILREMVDALFENTEIKEENIGKGELVIALLEREKQQPTSLGDGFAFPHARFPELKSFYMLFGICRDGVEFNSLDDKATNFFIMTIVSSANPEILLKSRAAMMRFMMPLPVRKSILKAKSRDEIWEMIDKSDVRVDYEILAKEIMRPQIGVLRPDMGLKEAAHALHKYHIDTLPLVDGSNNFIRDITCHDIFVYGLPDLFANIRKAPSMKDISAIDAFFKVNQAITLKDLRIDRPSPVIDSEAPLMEVIYQMTLNARNILYVVKNKKILGVIDRYNIIDKVLMG